MPRTSEIVLIDNLIGQEGFFFVGITQPKGNTHGFGEVVSYLAKQRGTGVIEFTTAAEIGNCEIQSVDVIASFVEVVGSQNPVQTSIIATAQQLKLLSDLSLFQSIVKLTDTMRRMIAIAAEFTIQVAPGADGLQS